MDAEFPEWEPAQFPQRGPAIEQQATIWFFKFPMVPIQEIQVVPNEEIGPAPIQEIRHYGSQTSEY